MPTKLYMDFITDTCNTSGWKVADTANKIALEQKKISLDQYREAARIIVDAYKKANW